MNEISHTRKTLVEILFGTRSIAIVGASEKPGAVGRDVIDNLLRKGYTGRIYPVNPGRNEVLGLQCYPSLAALPDRVGLVVVAVPAVAAVDVVRDAGRAGADAVLVLASGFAEAGAAGQQLQKSLQQAAAECGMRLIGPNCQGLMNIAQGVHIGFGLPYALDYTPGHVSLVSQSGAFGNSLLMGMDAEGVGTRHYISTGNEADIDALSVIEAYLDDPQTRVIAGYLEGLRQPGKLRLVAAKAQARDVPLVIWKVGRSEAGAKAAASHTASLSGNDRLLRSALRQFGIVEATDIGDMADCVRALQSGRKAKGNRVGVVTISGGAGVAMADRAADFGLQLPELAPATLEILRQHLPAFASLANPLDVTAGATADPAGFTKALEAVINDPGVDMLALSLAAISGKPAQVIADAISAASQVHDLPIVVAWNAPEDTNRAAFTRIRAAGLPVYDSPARAIRGLAAIWQNSRARAVATLPVQPPMGETGIENEMQSKTHLSDTGINAPREAVVFDTGTAAERAGEIGYPVVMKLLSSHLAHKSDIGGVRVGLSDRAAVMRAYDELAAIPARQTPPLPFEGVLIQEQITGAVETILGARHDPDFGPMIMVGCGGVFAEILDDVALRLAPVSVSEAQEMIDETRLPGLLSGWRGADRADRDALAKAISALSEKIVNSDTFAEIEINPLFIRDEGKGVVAGDCVAHIRCNAKQAGSTSPGT